jgi:hypothetical protein
MQLISPPNTNTPTPKSSAKPKIATALASATCALLSAGATQAQDAGWQIDTAVLLYSEKDRVDAVEPVVRATKRFADDSVVTAKVVADSLTGASPSGASPTNVPQTFTRPSGNGSYTTPAGETPLDDTFKDTRTQVALGYDRPLGDLSRLSVGINFSSEFDYQSFGLSGSWQRDFNKRNTTLLFGLAYASDTIKPKGGIPVPFASMQPAGTPPIRSGSDEDKQVTDVIILLNFLSFILPGLIGRRDRSN